MYLSGNSSATYHAFCWLKRETTENSLLMGFDHLGLYLYTGRKALAPAMTRDPQGALEYIDRTGCGLFRRSAAPDKK